MVPVYYVWMNQFPLTPNGKLDRKILPHPVLSAGASYVAPETEMEVILVRLWADVLRLDKAAISITSGFFELGGNSLKAIVLISEIHRALDLELNVKDVFIKQTIQHLADYIITLKQVDYNTNTSEKIVEVSI
jgi:acyl carrier protein